MPLLLPFTRTAHPKKQDEERILGAGDRSGVSKTVKETPTWLDVSKHGCRNGFPKKDSPVLRQDDMVIAALPVRHAHTFASPPALSPAYRNPQRARFIGSIVEGISTKET